MSNDNERTQQFPPEPSYTGLHYYPSAPQYFGYEPQQKPPGAKNGQALTSMVLGIVALCFAWPFTWPVGLICGILAVIFGTKGKQHSQGKAGRIMGWIAAPLSIVWLIVWIIAISSVNHAINQYNSHYNSATPSIRAKAQANSPDQCIDPN